MSLRGKKIIVGVTASIAAYKSAYLVRLLKKAGAHVKVVMTPASFDFITPITLSTLSKNPVYSDFVNNKKSGEWNNHVDLGIWADLMLVAPASANTIAKMASGACDNFLLATFLSARCPVHFAPAMDLDMYKHPSTQCNIASLVERGNVLIDAESGELASGLVGEGRMAEPEHILEHLEQYFSSNLPLKGKKCLISAGPTYEAIDPVRFIGNHSTGKMGYALAERAAELGAEVVLVSGPSSLSVDHPNISRVDVVSAREMYEAVTENFSSADIAIMSAAVADYRPKEVASSKMKKMDDNLKIELEPTTDVLKSLGENKKEGQLLVGFALETDNELENAKGKLKRKNLDLIVLNSLKDKSAGFGHDTNKITLIDKDNKTIEFELKTKADVANDIWEKILNLMS